MTSECKPVLSQVPSWTQNIWISVRIGSSEIHWPQVQQISYFNKTRKKLTMGKSREYLHTTGREKTLWCWGLKLVEVSCRAENLMDLFLLFSRLDGSTKIISHIKSWLSVDFVFKNLGQWISRVPYLLVTACAHLEILFEWTPRTTKDNYVVVTSNSTALLLEILSAPILRKLQQVCCMKRKTRDDSGHMGVKIKVCNILFSKEQLLKLLSEN